MGPHSFLLLQQFLFRCESGYGHGYRLYHKTPHVFRSISPFKLHKKWIRFQNPMLGSRLGSALGKICWILICRKRRRIHNPDPHSLFSHLRFFFQRGSWSGSTPGYQKMVKKQLVYISELHKLCYHHQHSTILSCFSHQSKKLINFFNSPRFSANVNPKSRLQYLDPDRDLH